MAAVTRRIIHVDMDEFFAAVEKLDHPEYRGKPLLVGGDPCGRGVVSTASYEAREFGCHSAMPMSKAIRLCPHALVLPVNFRRYNELSRQVFEVLEQFTPLVEPLSCDEAFLDVTGSRRLLGEAAEIAGEIKRRVRQATGLTASVGVAPNKFLAKIASDLRKPDGLVVIDEGNLHATLDPLPIRKLWGVGPKTAQQFERLNIGTVGQLRRTPVETLAMVLGDGAAHYLDLANGRDERPVTPDGEAKSIGQEETFATNLADREELREVVRRQAEHVAQRLRKHGLRARTVTLKIRYGDFRTITRSVSLPEATHQTQALWAAAAGVFEAWASEAFAPLRLVGVTASNFQAGARQLGLFAEKSARQERLDSTLDDIARKFGSGVVNRGRVPDPDE